MIALYFTVVFWNLRKIFTQKKWGQIIVGSTYLLVLGFLFLAILLLGGSTFRFLYTFSVVSEPIVKYILLTALVFTAFVSVLSFIITFSQRLFNPKFTPYFLAGVKPTSFFQAIFWENSVLGGWPFLILALPLLLAFLVVTGAEKTSFGVLFLLLFLLTILTASLGGILALTFRSFFGRASKKVVYALTGLVFFGSAIILKNVFLPAGLLEVAQRPTLKEVFAGLSSLPVALPFLPTTLFLESLSGKTAAFLTFASQTAIFYFLLWVLVKKLYKKTWQKAQEGIFLAQPHQKVPHPKKATKFHGLLPSLFKRELLSVDRSPSLLGYLAFIVFLAGTFFFLLSQSPRSPEFSPSIFRKILALTMTVIGYLTTMAALRLSFPALSLEFRRFWVLSSLQRVRQKVILVKWLIYTLLPALLAWLWGIFAFVFLRLPFEFLPFILVFSLSQGVLISAVNLLLGTIPTSRLPKVNIDELTTALPGVVATLFSILIACIWGFLFYQVTEITPEGIVFTDGGRSPLLILLVTLSCGSWYLSLRLAQKKFSQMDIH